MENSNLNIKNPFYISFNVKICINTIISAKPLLEMMYKNVILLAYEELNMIL